MTAQILSSNSHARGSAPVDSGVARGGPSQSACARFGVCASSRLREGPSSGEEPALARLDGLPRPRIQPGGDGLREPSSAPA